MRLKIFVCFLFSCSPLFGRQSYVSRNRTTSNSSRPAPAQNSLYSNVPNFLENVSNVFMGNDVVPHAQAQEYTDEEYLVDKAEAEELIAFTSEALETSTQANKDAVAYLIDQKDWIGLIEFLTPAKQNLIAQKAAWSIKHAQKLEDLRIKEEARVEKIRVDRRKRIEAIREKKKNQGFFIGVLKVFFNPTEREDCEDQDRLNEEWKRKNVFQKTLAYMFAPATAIVSSVCTSVALAGYGVKSLFKGTYRLCKGAIFGKVDWSGFSLSQDERDNINFLHDRLANFVDEITVALGDGLQELANFVRKGLNDIFKGVYDGAIKFLVKAGLGLAGLALGAYTAIAVISALASQGIVAAFAALLGGAAGLGGGALGFYLGYWLGELLGFGIGNCYLFGAGGSIIGYLLFSYIAKKIINKYKARQEAKKLAEEDAETEEYQNYLYA